MVKFKKILFYFNFIILFSIILFFIFGNSCFALG